MLCEGALRHLGSEPLKSNAKQIALRLMWMDCRRRAFKKMLPDGTPIRFVLRPGSYLAHGDVVYWPLLALGEYLAATIEPFSSQYHPAPRRISTMRAVVRVIRKIPRRQPRPRRFGGAFPGLWLSPVSFSGVSSISGAICFQTRRDRDAERITWLRRDRRRAGCCRTRR